MPSPKPHAYLGMLIPLTAQLSPSVATTRDLGVDNCHEDASTGGVQAQFSVYRNARESTRPD